VTRLDVTLPEVGDAIAWRTREWIITNGLGGYASGSLAGVCTRRYHGMFVPSLHQPRGRHVLVSRLDEQITIAGRTYRLGGGDRVGEALAPADSLWLREFHLDGNAACWTFVCDQLVLERRLVMPHQRNTACLRYEIKSDASARIRVRPWLPFRRQDAPLHRAGYGKFELSVMGDGGCRVALAESELWFAMRLNAQGALFSADAEEEMDAFLWREEARGYESHEVVASPGHWEWQAEPHVASILVMTTEESPQQVDVDRPFEEEGRRIAELVERAGAAKDPVLARLTVAADQFLILPDKRAEENAEAALPGHVLRTVVAGYHWFLDWGRDTMISLEGLMLATGRQAEARATLLTFSHYLRDGLLPNLFPEGSRDGWYHTVDATLWYLHAIHRYECAVGEASLVVELLPTLRDIMRHHIDGTRFNIGVDPEDGLLRAGTPDHALTWMDAHMGDWIVTPRRGKPVEIQALWYNALCLMQGWETEPATRADYARRADLARRSFNAKFWNPARNCLFDVIESDGGNDARLRPNQLFAISLDHPVLDEGHRTAVLETVRTALLTPVGLRTLDEQDRQYSRSYHGNLRTRDAAYHQGTVWTWLLGAYIDACLRTHGDSDATQGLLAAFPGHLQVAGLGSISEVFDGEWPHAPHGCIAQAWSVAEVLRCWKRLAARESPRDGITDPAR
jgi:predicted glycogen debranching enzyme